MAQTHMLIFFWGAVICLLVVMFEPQIKFIVRMYAGTSGMAMLEEKIAQQSFSDDLYHELRFDQLYEE